LCLLVGIIGFCVAPYFSNLLPGGGEEEQKWLDKEIAFIERRVETCEDDYVRSAMEYVLKNYREIGIFRVRVMQLPEGTHAYNMPTCPGTTVDEEVLRMGVRYGAFVLIHEAMHNFPPYLGHYHIDNDAILEEMYP
jgi:hypothetical protein